MNNIYLSIGIFCLVCIFVYIVILVCEKFFINENDVDNSYKNKNGCYKISQYSCLSCNKKSCKYSQMINLYEQKEQSLYKK